MCEPGDGERDALTQGGLPLVSRRKRQRSGVTVGHMPDDEESETWFCREVLPLERQLTVFVRQNWRVEAVVSDRGAYGAFPRPVRPGY
jgi:hypothetical protein